MHLNTKKNNRLQLVLNSWASILLLSLLSACSSGNNTKESQPSRNSSSSLTSTPSHPNMELVNEMGRLIHLYESNSKELELEISKIAPEERKAMTLSYSTYFYKTITPMNEKLETTFHSFIRILDKLFPELRFFNYFYVSEKTNNINILDLDGARVLINYFNSHKQYRHRLDRTYSINIIHLLEELNALETNNVTGEVTFLVQHIVWGHFTPVFIRRSDNQTRIVLTDAGAWDSIMGWVPKIKNIINESTLKNVQIFSFAPWRQTDAYSCPIISIRDTLENTRFNLFDFVEANQSKFQPAPHNNEQNNLFLIHGIPPAFMKVTQSGTALTNYEKLYPEYRDVIVNEKNQTLKALTDAYTTPGIIRNRLEQPEVKDVKFYTRKKAFKYFDIIIQSLLALQEP